MVSLMLFFVRRGKIGPAFESSLVFPPFPFSQPQRPSFPFHYFPPYLPPDVLNVSGHRLGSAEIESALVANHKVSEAAVIGFPHDTKGEGICCYVTLKEGVQESDAVVAELRNQVRKVIGPFATPDHIVLTAALPKTRSGKIMRRVLRKIIARQTDQLGDITTLADSGVIVELIAKVEKLLGPAPK